MSWMEKLYQTYEAGVLLDLPQEKLPMPTSHTLQNAHINIVIDGEGNFKRASVLEKTQIILPATESSASRSSGEAPHPLADKLQYVAKDYEDFGGKKKAYFEGYKRQLQAWCESEHAHEKVRAIYHYIEKGTVIRDLLANNIVFVDSDNILLTQWNSDNGETPPLFKVLPKEKGMLDQGSALVCWTVEKPSDPSADTWKDGSIQASWIAYDTLDGSNKGLCYITGQEQTLSTNHPAKIRHSGDKAKLISSNDTSGYTYRGRFLDDGQASAIGFDVSQKAHNGLRWLISRQGFRNGDQAYVSWAVSGNSIPEPLKDAYSFLDTDDFDLEEVEESETPITAPVLDHSRDLGESYARQLKKYMAGYAAKLSPNEQIIIMGIDSATPGRMGIIYYRELFSHDFLNRLETWHSQFAWPQRHTKEITNTTGKKPKTKVIWPISSPVPMAIAKAAYGENVTDNLKKKVIERLMPCIIDGQPFPIDLVMSCVRKATNRVSYASDAQWLWEKNLGIACALYKGYHQRHPNLTQRREYAMALEENYHARDYLFGRLLAIAERIEDVALSVSGENRPTTAARLMQRFADRPFETWRTIELALQPYMQRLRVSRAGFLTNQLKELDTVQAMFKHDDFTSKAALSGEFLLGYHCQRQKFKTKSETTDETLQGDSE
ncbi:MAG: type I-C CRISPR-associated protein Cas8c/Csd1 [Methylococcaceae bacterium]|nr:type I-C CRISPR-associated protein Cas8c/Csd1 [Methylococcaceae bacterium]MDZ4155601.1 type I-C CRISPR-associated protein Cas8c/Csd1 [Methylococcales bacterium]MDP2395324.1 type I-C CRISPR-associated protein Cas8c/Csd1 [Methylococcaceae bacterium]MDP3020564.1 type I-C CRISPR-associated protein Cas8c/Csd1 [Methylococcaceae bacterium]MDP3390003.1 type I-C CRISPR-associated protein Cas8c/Csd1 [Methylococcaceae bacterium]